MDDARASRGNDYENHEITKILERQALVTDNSCSLPHYRGRTHRHTTSWTAQSDYQSRTLARERAATVAPTLPPKQHKQAEAPRSELTKSRSLDPNSVPNTFERTYDSHPKESPYIALKDVATYPTRSQTTKMRGQNQQVMSHIRPVPNKPAVRMRAKKPLQALRNNDHFPTSTGKPPPSPTFLVSTNSKDMYEESKVLSELKQFRPVSPYQIRPHSPMSSSPESITRLWSTSSSSAGTFTPSISQPGESSMKDIQPETAIYGGVQDLGANLVMDFNRIRNKLSNLYKTIADTPGSSTMIMDLKKHLKLMEHESTSGVLQSVYSALAPPTDGKEIESQMLYVVDFRRFRDKYDLKQKIIQMFAKPGPPSISYAKVDAKMDNVITEFSARAEALRSNRNDFIESPFHARNVLQGLCDTESLVKALRENQLWIRWGTATNLPPLSHLYMHKQPPSYEVRKAVTISFIAERQKAMHDTFKSAMDPKVLCPPIYSRLTCSSSSQTLWQVTEYNEDLRKFESRPCTLPSWLDEEQSAKALLKSSNRSVFDAGEHPYALYSVYVIIIKDFTLAHEESSRKIEREFSKSTPSKCQYYVGSSSTGVLYRFTEVENSHCSRAFKVLCEASKLKHYRCYEGCDLVEACLALSWARRQPRAVFVVNTFLPRNMASLTLEQKKPFNEKMLALANNLISGKKTGPLCDMRYGMNGTTTIQEDENNI